ncbi:MAG: SIS domain-containing protein [Actinomycetota bacterium]|nr:SIS domain-containing protein [Actinomycetota bacterium]
MSVDFRRAIFAQPENLAAASDAFRSAAAEVDLSALCHGTIVLSGIGASALALIPAVLALRAAGRRAFVVSAGELRKTSAARLGDSFVLVSQSGASAETVASLECIDGAPVVAISAQGDSPLAQAARVWLPLGPIPDTPVATLSYTATLQALGMLVDELLGGKAGRSVWQRLPELAAGVLEGSDPMSAELAESFAQIVALDAVGGGPDHASAGETALLGREALRLPSSGMETREYLHGPLEAVTEQFGSIVFGRERELSLARELASFGAAVALITDIAGAEAGGARTIELPSLPSLAAPVVQILPVQLLVDHVARIRGLEIGALRRQQLDTKLR